jgi:hypothetical protein
MNTALFSKMEAKKTIIYNAVIYKILKAEKKENFVYVSWRCHVYG